MIERKKKKIFWYVHVFRHSLVRSHRKYKLKHGRVKWHSHIRWWSFHRSSREHSGSKKLLHFYCAVIPSSNFDRYISIWHNQSNKCNIDFLLALQCLNWELFVTSAIYCHSSCYHLWTFEFLKYIYQNWIDGVVKWNPALLRMCFNALSIHWRRVGSVRPCLICKKIYIAPITSNFRTHAWSIKCSWKNN